jgi:hypothetical protein
VDAVKNFAWSTVATAPSPATTGTSLTVTAGEGARYPAVPFNASVFPAGTMPTPVNAEIVRVTARTTDVLTITRTQEGSSARAIVVGDQIAAAITAKTLTDLDLGFANPMSALGDIITGAASGVPQRLAIGATNTVLTVVGGIPTWAANAAMLNPMTAIGDVILGGAAGAPTRLAAVAAGQVLASAGVTTAPVWNASPTLAGLTVLQPAGAVALTISKTASGQLASIFGQTAGSTRWQISPGEATAETGANAGSEFAIYAYTDAGAFLATPFSIKRATSDVYMLGPLRIQSAAFPTLYLNKPAAGQGTQFFGQTAGVNRWLLQLGDSVAESGGNAGSNFSIFAYTDAGAYFGTPFSITRSDGTNPIVIVAGGLTRALTLGAVDSGGAGFRIVRVAN